MPSPLANQSRPLRALRWVAGPVVLAALVLWVAGFRSPAAAQKSQGGVAATPVTEQPQGFAASALGPAAFANLSKAARESAVRDTARVVAEKNADSEQQRKAFAADGWETVKAVPPDAEVLALEPRLLESREDELQAQIASTVARPADADKLAEIARRAHQPRTRTAAVEALGRVGGPESQRALFGLLTGDELKADDPARRAVAPLLRPSELADPYAAKLAAQLDARGLDAIERKQIAFTLALIGLRDGTELPRDVLAQLSPASRDLLAQMIALATLKNPARQEP